MRAPFSALPAVHSVVWTVQNKAVFSQTSDVCEADLQLLAGSSHLLPGPGFRAIRTGRGIMGHCHAVTAKFYLVAVPCLDHFSGRENE